MNNPYQTDVYELSLHYLKAYGDTARNLHIIFSDGNVEDTNIQFCRVQCIEKYDPFGRFICDMLDNLTVDQRCEVVQTVIQWYRELGGGW